MRKKAKFSKQQPRNEEKLKNPTKIEDTEDFKRKLKVVEEAYKHPWPRVLFEDFKRKLKGVEVPPIEAVRVPGFPKISKEN